MALLAPRFDKYCAVIAELFKNKILQRLSQRHDVREADKAHIRAERCPTYVARD